MRTTRSFRNQKLRTRNSKLLSATTMAARQTTGQRSPSALASRPDMSRKLKRKIERTAAKAAPRVDEDAVIERTAAFSAVVNEWGAALLGGAAATTDAIAANVGDFAGQVWNLASGAAPVDEITATLLRTYPATAHDEASDATRPETLLRDLVGARRARFASETRLVEAVVLQHLGGKRFFLALPIGWDAELS